MLFMGEFRRVLAKNRGQTRRLLVQSRTPKKSFVFLSLVWRALASGGGAVQSFRSKWVRAKFRIEHFFFVSIARMPLMP